MSGINFQRTYLLSESYESIKERANHVLHKYRGYPELITFDDVVRTLFLRKQSGFLFVSANRQHF
jgi:hypothetical protein